MDELHLAAEIRGGYLMRHHLIEMACTDKTIRALVRSGRLHRVRHGTYSPMTIWAGLDEVGQHRVAARSLLDRLGDSVTASHQTACALHGLDLHGADLSQIHLTRVDNLRGRSEAGVTFHAGAVVPDTGLVRIDGRPVTEVRRAVIEAASVASTETGMIIASSALRSGELTHAELDDHAQQYSHWPRTRHARLAIRLSDGQLASVGEVRSLFLMWQHHIPRPELQVQIVDRHGRVVARTDFAWLLARHTGEFDGLFKYGRLNPHPHDPGQVLATEKVREDLVRDCRWGMSRWVWAGLEKDARSATARRILEGIEQSRRLYTGNRTVIALG